MFILDANRYARDPAGVSGQIPRLVEKCGGEILASRLWNEQKLAYPIRGQRKGTYWLTYFRMDSDKLVEFNRSCRLHDSILRNLTIRVENRLVAPLVAHARGEVERSPKDAESGKASPETAVAEASAVAAEGNGTAAAEGKDTAPGAEGKDAAPGAEGKATTPAEGEQNPPSEGDAPASS
jgi:small subunit ribosomal protein S6